VRDRDEGTREVMEKANVLPSGPVVTVLRIDSGRRVRRGLEDRAEPVLEGPPMEKLMSENAPSAENSTR
jgi:hypothetical protein